jgi:hypothetical protein
VGGYEIPQDVSVNGLFQRLADNSMDVIACTNDLFSIRKDSRDGNGPGNQVLILEGLRQLSLQDATDEARKMTRNALKELQSLNLLAMELSLPEKMAQRHLATMEDWMSSSFEWHSLSGRYH